MNQKKRNSSSFKSQALAKNDWNLLEESKDDLELFSQVDWNSFEPQEESSLIEMNSSYQNIEPNWMTLNLSRPFKDRGRSSLYANMRPNEFCMNQINFYQKANADLQKQLEEVTRELEELKELKNQTINANTSQTWHSFTDNNLAFSHWQKKESNELQPELSSLLLVEFNTKFRDLLGYPKTFLQHNFTLDKMLCEYSNLSLEKGGVIYIMTSRGSKKVTMKISSQPNTKSYIILMNEIQ